MRFIFSTMLVVVTPMLLTLQPLDYKRALTLALTFYDAQRSGPIASDFPITWRGSSGMADGKDMGVDLTGGYYDAGDHVKFLLPMAHSMTLLAWSGLLGSNDADNLDAVLRWGTDWILKTKNGEKVFVQVGSPKLDHSFMGPPERMTHSRPSFYVDAKHPGTEPVAEASAALAASSIFWETKDPTYSLLLKTQAEEYFNFAMNNQGLYHLSVPEAAQYYKSNNGFYDELAWSATWLYLATKNPQYLMQARQLFDKYVAAAVVGSIPSWDDKSGYTLLLLTYITKDDTLKAMSRNLITRWVDGANPVTTTPGGLAWVMEWGSLRYAANMAFMALFYHTHIESESSFREFGEKQIRYILGENPRNSSYLIGYGKNPPKNPHHRGAINARKFWPSAPSVLNGALVGGPVKPDDFSYEDSSSNFKSNEVALDYNAGFIAALTILANTK